MVIGVMLYSFALTSISHFIQIHGEKKKKLQEKKKYLDNLNVKYNIDNVNSTLYYKIKRHLSHQYNYDKNNKNSLLFELPLSLRNQMIFNMYREVINSFNFFRDCNHEIDFITQAIFILKPTVSMKNDSLIKQGDFIEKLFLLKKEFYNLNQLFAKKI